MSRLPSYTSSSSLSLLSYYTTASLSFWHLLTVALLMFAHLSAHQSFAVASLAAQSDLLMSQQQQQHGQEQLQQQQHLQDVVTDSAVMTPGQLVIAAVPQAERGKFVYYQLVQALNNTFAAAERINPRFMVIDNISQQPPLIPAKEMRAFNSVPTYANFTKDLFQWVMQKFNANEMDIYRMVQTRELLCTANGICYTEGEIGSLCCPF